MMKLPALVMVVLTVVSANPWFSPNSFNPFSNGNSCDLPCGPFISCNDQCTFVDPVESDLSQFLELSPFFVVATLNKGLAKHIDNVCYTVFVDKTGEFFLSKFITYVDGQSDIVTTSTYDSNDDNVYSAEGGSCDFEYEVIGQLNCGVDTFYTFNRCFCTGLCSQDTEVIITATSANPNQACLEEAVNRAQQIFPCYDFYFTPNQQTPKCVTPADLDKFKQ